MIPSETPTSPTLINRIGSYLLGLVGRLFVYWTLYSLSIGPCFWYWFESTHVDGPKWVGRFYTPLLIVCEIFPWYGRFMNAYIDLWIVG